MASTSGGGTAQVGLSLPAVGAVVGVPAHIDRAEGVLGPGHLDDDDVPVGGGLHPGPLLRHQVGADGLGVLHPGEEFLQHLLGVQQALDAQGVVAPLLHPQQDDAPVGVGKGGVGLPEALGQPTGGQLGLQTGVFPVGLDPIQRKHGNPLLSKRCGLTLHSVYRSGGGRTRVRKIF